MVDCYRLSDEERERLDTDGYLVRTGQFTTDEVVTITRSCEELISRLVAGRQGRRYHVGSYVFDPDALTEVTIKWEGDTDVVHGIEPFAHLSPELETWAYDARFVEPMVDFVGHPAPVLFTEKLNLKRPYHGGPNPLHQDYPYWERLADDATRVATAMLFLDDSNVENGTLRVVPGSHKQGMWRTRSDSDAFGNLEIDRSLDEESAAVPVEVEAGSIVYFGAFLVHKSAPNTSGKDRRALLYSYQPEGLTHARDLIRAERERAIAERERASAR